ncbi:MAG: S9 family peptidase [Bacteroidales bacterium]|nr:S9 family peptidase [Bacteroidales bacterium]
MEGRTARIITVSFAALLSVCAAAETLRVRPATEGRVMTIEESTIGGLYPKIGRYAFGEGGELLVRAGAGKWNHVTEEKPYIPSGKPWEAVSENGSLYVVYKDGTKVAVAESEEDGIVYGETVSRNEFGIDGGIFVSPDSSKVAFYRKDERAVTKFPVLDITTRTGTLKEFRYPMAGMASEHITLGVYDIAKGSTVYMDVTDFDDERYLTNISWTPRSSEVLIQVLDRAQQNVRLNRYSAATGEYVSTVLTEHNDRFVEPEDPLHFVSDEVFIYRTDNRDGYRNLYLVKLNGSSITRLTAVDADVAYVASDSKYVYYTSAEVSPVENHLFRIPLKKGRKGAVTGGKPQRLTFEEGWHTITMNPAHTEFIDSWSSVCFPGAEDLCSTDGKSRRRLSTAEDPFDGYLTGEVGFGSTPSADGAYENYYRLFKPAGFDPAKKYPVILYVYGGPHSQMVRNSWMGGIRNWEMYMAERGYIVYVQDNRGTSNRGAGYEKAIWRRCGVHEMEDQVAGLSKILAEPWADEDRVGVCGWSYGGFMTISLLPTYPEIFKAAAAGGPVIDWKWYEIMYGERYMSRPEDNPDGYAETSLIGKVGNLEGDLLICQGAIDNTVVWEHSLSFIQECVKQWKPVDYFPYPVAEHNVRGRDRVHLMAKLSKWFEDKL